MESRGEPKQLAQTQQGSRPGSSALRTWIEAAHALALLRGALSAGNVEVAQPGRTAAEIGAVIGRDPGQTELVCVALEAHGILDRDGGTYRLADELAPLASPDASFPLADVLAWEATRAELLFGATTDRLGKGLAPDDALTFAKAVGRRPTAPATLEEMTGIARAIPEVERLWQAGGRHIEYGCGVGGTLISLLRLYPAMTAVGIDLEPGIVEEAQRRVNEAGVANRLELRVGDAADVVEDAGFDTLFWSQPAFPRSSRSAVLASACRTLRPEGYLLVPLLPGTEKPTSSEGWRTPAGRAYALSQLLNESWDVPILGQ